MSQGRAYAPSFLSDRLFGNADTAKRLCIHDSATGCDREFVSERFADPCAQIQYPDADRYPEAIEKKEWVGKQINDAGSGYW